MILSKHAFPESCHAVGIIFLHFVDESADPLAGGEERRAGGEERRAGGEERCAGGEERCAGGEERCAGGEERCAGGEERCAGGEERCAGGCWAGLVVCRAASGRLPRDAFQEVIFGSFGRPLAQPLPRCAQEPAIVRRSGYRNITHLKQDCTYSVAVYF